MASNRRKGAEFAERVRVHLESLGIEVEPEYSVGVGVNRSRTKARRFDWGNGSVLVECKAYDWTAGGNNPSAKLTTVNEAMLYFLAAPQHFRKMLFISATRESAGRRPETLGRYYVRTYAHLIPEGVEVHELEPHSLKAVRLWPEADPAGNGPPHPRPAARRSGGAAAATASETSFPLRLGRTYYNRGFFNVPRGPDDLVGGEGAVTLVLGGGRRVEARIDRRSNPNGTARVMGGAALRDWLRRTYREGDEVAVRIDGPRRLALG